MMRMTFLALAAAALLAAPAASANPGTRSFQRTFPHAARLCAKVANGHTPRRLAASATQVAGDCAQLKSSLTAAETTYTTTVAPLNGALRQARTAHDRAHRKALRKQLRDARRAYHVSVNTARKAFWSDIRALRGS